MYLSDATLDDLLRRVLKKLLDSKQRINPRRGPATEITGILLRLTNPRARLSHTEKKGKIFSCLGELLWYLAKSDQLAFISYYLKEYKEDSDDGKTLHGAYGPRIFAMRGHDQVENLLRTLGESRDSRRAVIQLFNAEDLAEKHKEIPCTCSLQFMIRRERLEMVTFMRSNDAFIGLSHDVFAFTMLQEIIARTLNIDLGSYKHFVGSLHLYDDDAKHARQYIEEGWQSTQSVAMPPMPAADPRPSITKLLKTESRIRRGKQIEISQLKLDPYWADLARLLLIYRHSVRRETTMIARIKKQMSSPIYNAYIAKRINTNRIAHNANN